MGVIAAAVVLFITEIVRVDVVAIIMMVLLPILGLVTPQDAFSGLASNAVVSIIAVIIIGAGLDKTGVMNKVAAPIVAFANGNVTRLISGISGTVAIISSFMQNIGAAALFLPATIRASKQLDIPLSRLLMPMGFCAILGGTVTLVGSSPLILLNELLANSDLPPFGLFSVTPIGLLLVASGILYFILFGKYILPERTSVKGEEVGGAVTALKEYGAYGKVYELKIPTGFKLSGKAINELQIRRTFLITVVAIAPASGETKVFSPELDQKIHSGDTLAVIGHESNVKKMAAYFGFTLLPSLKRFAEDLSDMNAGLMEGIVGPRSVLLGSTFRETNFCEKFNVSPVALFRDGKVFVAGLSDIPIEQGDALLLHGKWETYVNIQSSPDLLLSTPVNHDVFRVSKAGVAVMSFSVALGLVILKDIFDLPLSLANCLMTGALLMVLTKVLTIDEAYKAVDWRTIFLLAGLIPLGIATETTGTAAYIAHHLLAAIGDVSPLVLFTVIGIMSTLFTLVISNVGATVLLVPLVINMALEAGADPRMAALVVGLAVSNSFILPTHQVNALLMGPGRYKTIDYIRAGSGMSVVFIVVMILGLWMFYGISG